MISLSRIAAAALVAAALCAGPASAAPDGATVFSQNCAACHQSDGRGIPGAFPALAHNSFVQGDPKEVAGVLLRGRGGMPNFRDDLSDADVAAVLSYVRSAWGNQASPIDAATVAGVRNGGAKAPLDTSSAVMPYH